MGWARKYLNVLLISRRVHSAAIRTHPFGQYDNPVSFAIVEFQVVGSHMECSAAIFSQGANMKAQQPKNEQTGLTARARGCTSWLKIKDMINIVERTGKIANPSSHCLFQVHGHSLPKRLLDKLAT